MLSRGPGCCWFCSHLFAPPCRLEEPLRASRGHLGIPPSRGPGRGKATESPPPCAVTQPRRWDRNRVRMPLPSLCPLDRPDPAPPGAQNEPGSGGGGTRAGQRCPMVQGTLCERGVSAGAPGEEGQGGLGAARGQGPGSMGGGGARARLRCMRRIKAAPAGRKPCKRSRREQPWAGGPSWAINFSEELWRAKKFPLLRSQGGGDTRWQLRW